MKFKSLRYFIQKTKVRLLYRDYVKTIYTIKDEQSRNEFMKQVNSEFKSQETVEDEGRIEYLIAIGRKQLPVVKQMIHMTQ